MTLFVYYLAFTRLYPDDCDQDKLRRLLSLRNIKLTNTEMLWLEFHRNAAWSCPQACSLLSTTMSRHRLTLVSLPAAKRRHTSTEQNIMSTPLLNFDATLYDELILVIFSYLSWTDLCSIQSVNRLWARLASDNQVCLLLLVYLSINSI